MANESYFDPSIHGQGFEGLLNYSNLLVDGWFVTGFLVFIFAVMTYVLSKSEWRMPGVLAFSSFTCFVTAMIFRLFTTVNEMIIFLTIIMTAFFVVWALLTDR